ncbi:8-oxoguanine DNA glycosylase [Clostridium sp. chh4-2]|uniref:DNA-3-methyladenine glycosylase family protein n=1 Tax=Clostridium sp. chh4-2 TaxID=2067550 RepID=UPI000CCE56BE|nr:DNA glycosylase [Clostridium sp. chh4-2]PNV61133.1 8-oxoguanine DNA glycosylase [Clostridium sp. chh4-2]
MYEVKIKDLDLNQIMSSGQCFRMRKSDDGIFSVPVSDKYVEIEQKGELFAFSCSREEFEAVWYPYLDLQTDYGKIKAGVDKKDEYLMRAVEYGSGIRILRQDLWEMIITFLISQNNNVSRIRNSIEVLCGRLGKRCISDGGAEYYAFPEPEAVLEAGMEGLSTMGLGYRDKYILKMAQTVSEGTLDLAALRTAGYEEAHQTLTAQFGIGKKVADCICLFGLHHVDAFPVDTHIKKILDRSYPDGFPYERYRGVLGIIQQYLFYYDLEGKM